MNQGPARNLPVTCKPVARLDSIFAAPARRLETFLRVAATGYCICVCNAPANRRLILDSLRLRLADHGIAVHDYELDDSEGNIMRRLRTELRALPALPAQYSKVAISLAGTAPAITRDKCRALTRPLHRLEYQWRVLDELGHPVLFWVTGWLSGTLRRFAPQFWAGRSLLIEFPTAAEARSHHAENPCGQLTFRSFDQAGRKIRIYQELSRVETEPAVRALFLSSIEALQDAVSELAAARELCEQSLAAKQQLGDKPGVAGTLHELARLTERWGDYDAARDLYTEALAIEKQLDDKAAVARTLSRLAATFRGPGSPADPRAGCEKLKLILEELGDAGSAADTLHRLASLAEGRRDYTEASRLYEQHLFVSQQLGDKPAVVRCCRRLASLAESRGDYEEARRLGEQALAAARELGDVAGIAKTLRQLAALAQNRHDYVEAHRLGEQLLSATRQLGDKPAVAKALCQLAISAQNQGDRAEARRLYDQSLAIKLELGDQHGVAVTLEQLGRLAATEEDDRTALRNYLQALAVFEGLKSPDKDVVTRGLAKMQQRLGDEAFKKLCDEVVAEVGRLTANR